MTIPDFSNKFDVYLSSYWVKPSYGLEFSYQTVELDEYEKSVFLTRAQEEYVKAYYTSSGNYGFEIQEEVRRSLDALVKTYDTTEAVEDSYILKYGNLHAVYSLPEDVWFIVYEEAVLEDQQTNPCLNGKTLLVVPTLHDDYYKTIRNPFKGPNANRVLRLDKGSNKVELVSNYPIQTYSIRYLSRPKPIILAPLPNGLTINNETSVMNCALNELAHEPILQIAVTMAAQSKGLIRQESKEDKK